MRVVIWSLFRTSAKSNERAVPSARTPAANVNQTVPKKHPPRDSSQSKRHDNGELDVAHDLGASLLGDYATSNRIAELPKPTFKIPSPDLVNNVFSSISM